MVSIVLLASGLTGKVAEQEKKLETLACISVKLRGCRLRGVRSRCCDKA